MRKVVVYVRYGNAILQLTLRGVLCSQFMHGFASSSREITYVDCTKIVLVTKLNTILNKQIKLRYLIVITPKYIPFISHYVISLFSDHHQQRPRSFKIFKGFLLQITGPINNQQQHIKGKQKETGCQIVVSEKIKTLEIFVKSFKLF